MKTLICLIALLGFVQADAAQQLMVAGHVRLSDGRPVAGAQVALFDVTDLIAGPVARATTDEVGYFAVSLKALGGTALPQDFTLGQNYPNPFNPSTIIPYQLPTSTHVRLDVFNALGQHVTTLVDGERSAGSHTAVWDATNAAGRAVGAGIYIYRLSGMGGTLTRKMVLLDGQAGGFGGGLGGLAIEESVEMGTQVYGLTVSGPGLVAYVDPAFSVAAGQGLVDLVVETPDRMPRMKVAADGLLGDVNNDSQVDLDDVLLMIRYIDDPSIRIPNNGDISLGDMDRDGQVGLADVLLVILSLSTSDQGTAQAVGSPDLIVRPPSVSSSTLSLGLDDEFSLSVEVRNQGDGASGSTEVHIYRSSDAIISSSRDSRVASVSVGSLSAAATNDVLVSLDVPSSAGTYYYGACVDAVRGESDTRNNCSLAVQVTVGAPDLTARPPSVSSILLDPVLHDEFPLSVAVHNQGDGASGSTEVDIYRSSDAIISSRDSRVASVSVGSLSAAATNDVLVSLDVPSSAGTYYYGACVDAVRGESDTRNNCSLAVQVTVGAPDLIVRLLSVGNRSGGRIPLSVLVRNQGNGTSGPPSLALYRSSTSTDIGYEVANWRSYSRRNVGSLPPATEATLGLIDNGSGEGSYYRVCVDSVRNESNTENNCSASYYVGEPQ